MTTQEPEFSQFDPGLDLHEWETQWQQYRDLAEDDPAQALPEMCDFVQSILEQRGIRPEQSPDAAGQEPDVIGAYRFAREIGDRVERGEDVGPGDIGAAHEALAEIYGWITTNRQG
ncbi:MAG TPA: hypothetical protein VM290_06855 [Gaiellaceae bacterium]|jgi:hypothetical protein|nr:hypothetical protein [Gaiellaceae bacterium]